MKKLLSLLLILAIVVTTVTVGVVSVSALTYDATIKSGSATYYANVGDVFTFTVSLKSAKKISAGQIEVPVDFSVLSGDTAEDLNENINAVAPVLSDTALVQRFDTPSKKGLVGYVFNFAADASYDFTTAKPAFTLMFTVVKAGTVTMNPVLREFLDENAKDIIDINGNKVGGTVTVSASFGAMPVPAVTDFANLENGLQLSWAACDGAVKYRVFRQGDDSKWVMLGDTADTSFVDTDVVAGTQYTYTVRCLNAKGKFISSYNKEGFTSYYIANPTLKSLTNGKGFVTVAWNPMNGAEKFRVFRKEPAKDTNWYQIGDTEANSFNDPIVESGVEYYYTVRCISADGAYTTPQIFDQSGITYISAPAVSKIENTASGAKVTWTAGNGSVKFRVFRKLATDKKWSKLADTTAKSYTDKTAKSGTAYTYTVRCLSADGKTMVSAYDTTGKKNTFITAPVAKSVTNVYGGVTFAWKKATGAAKYRVFRKLGSGSWKKLGDTTSLTWTDKKAAAGKTYSYAARAITKDGKSYTSALGTTKKIQYVAAPTLGAVTKGKGFVKFTWKKSTGAVKYRVMRKVGTGKWAKLADTKSLTYTDKKVVKKKKYTYSVCCLDKKGKVISGYNTTGKAITYK